MPRPRICAAFALLLAAAPASATVVQPLDLADLVGLADQIVVARVERMEARWSGDHQAIFTEVTLRVGEAMKGDRRGGETLVVRREGGEVDGIGMRVVGAARFQVGEEVVVFAERRGAALWTVGLAQGKLRVAVTDGRKVALPMLDGLELGGAGATLRGPVPLDELRRRVAALVELGRPRSR